MILAHNAAEVQSATLGRQIDRILDAYDATLARDGRRTTRELAAATIAEQDAAKCSVDYSADFGIGDGPTAADLDDYAAGLTYSADEWGAMAEEVAFRDSYAIGGQGCRF